MDASPKIPGSSLGIAVLERGKLRTQGALLRLPLPSRHHFVTCVWIDHKVYVPTKRGETGNIQSAIPAGSDPTGALVDY
jgi:hypothetical protein